jgi:phosphate butyryltransferase
MIRSLPDMLVAARAGGELPVLVCAAAHDQVAIEAARDVAELGLAHPVLVGDRPRIEAMCEMIGWASGADDLVDEPDALRAAQVAAAMCAAGSAQAMMKGAISTSGFLKSVLAVTALRTGSVFVHATAFRPPGRRRLMLMADAGVNISPDVGTKISMVESMAGLARSLGVEMPRVALLAAAETVSSRMPSTVDASRVVAHFAAVGSPGALVGGPYALDVAVSMAAAQRKGLVDDVAGRADVLLTPDIDAGNVLYKSLTCIAGLELASIVIGAAVPLVVPSRADSRLTRLYSVAMALLAGRRSLPLRPGHPTCRG